MVEETLLGDGKEGRAGCVALLHCVEGHSSSIDAHGKGGVSTFIATKMSYCLFTGTDTKGGRDDNGAFVCECVCATAYEFASYVKECKCKNVFMQVCVWAETGKWKENDYFKL